METIIKIADARYPEDPAYLKHWLDGQLIGSRPDGHKWGTMEYKNFLIIRTPDKYDLVKGPNDTRHPTSEAFYRLFNRSDSNGKIKGQFGYLEEEKRLLMVDHFLDIKGLLNDGLLTITQFDKLYLHGEPSGIINIDRSLFDLAKNERSDFRSEIIPPKNQGITSGTYQIGTGAGADYSIWNSFIADVNSGGQLTGDLTGEGQDEATELSAAATVDVDTNGYLLKLTAENGAEHSGAVYGNGARIAVGSSEEIKLDETTAGDLANVEFSKLAFSYTGYSADGLIFWDADVGTHLINRCLFAGNGTDSRYAVYFYKYSATGSAILTARNNIIYGASSGYSGIYNYQRYGTLYIDNNTICKNGIGININHAGGTSIVRNNICQGNATDFLNPSNIDTHSSNYAEDATSPDSLQRDVHDAFLDYTNNDYRLNSAGDAGDLAVLANGTDLSGTFTDDIVGTIRSTFYIGAFEYVAAGGTTYTLTADAGSYAVTGQNAALLASRSISAATGSYGITGQSANLLHNRLLTAVSGSYGATGQAASLLYNRLLSVDVGSYGITGQDCTLTYVGSYILSVDPGSFNISGVASNLLWDHILQAEAGVFGLTGTAGELLKGSKLSSETGIYTLTGSEAILTYNDPFKILTCESGNYLITGKDVSFLYSGIVIVGEMPTRIANFGTDVVITTGAVKINELTIIVYTSTKTITFVNADEEKCLVVEVSPGEPFSLSGLLFPNGLVFDDSESDLAVGDLLFIDYA